MTNDEVTAIAARLAKTTPGEWTVPKQSDVDVDNWLLLRDDQLPRGGVIEVCATEADLVFIRHAREDMLALLTRIRRLTLAAEDAIHDSEKGQVLGFGQIRALRCCSCCDTLTSPWHGPLYEPCPFCSHPIEQHELA